MFQSVADSAVAAQERNVQFVQSFLENGTEVVRSHVEGTRTLMNTLIDQSRKQREAFGVLARGTWDAYRGFFPSPYRYYERTMERVESMTSHRAEVAHKMVHEERPVAHAAKK